MSLYVVIKFAHIALAIIAVGFNASYGIWLASVAREPSHGLFVLQGIKRLDDRFANPAYALLLVTGLAMLIIGGIPLTTFWIAAALALYAVLIVLGLGVYTPTLRKQIALFEDDGPASPAYRRLASRGTLAGIVLAIDAVAIVFLMVAKPTL